MAGTKEETEMERAKQEQEKVDSWNNLFDVGQTVILTKDGGVRIGTTTRAKAEAIGGTACGWFKGVSGAYMLDRARPI